MAVLLVPIAAFTAVHSVNFTLQQGAFRDMVPLFRIPIIWHLCQRFFGNDAFRMNNRNLPTKPIPTR